MNSFYSVLVFEMTFPLVLVLFLGGWFLVPLVRRHLTRRPKYIDYHEDKEGGEEPERIEVLIPDMFQSFLKQPPRVNPHYETVKLESEKWINEFVISFLPNAHPNPTLDQALT
jgi:hypothetical protein